MKRRTRFDSLRLILCSMLIGLSLTACGDDSASEEQNARPDAAIDPVDAADQGDAGADAGGEAPTWSGQVWPILQNYDCGNGYCHGGGRGGLDWGDEAATYDEFVGVVSDDDNPCAGSTRVVPSDASGSLLLRKITGTQDCGSQMPPDGASVAEADVEVIRAWIEGGAKR